ncbi:unnamed protein product [Thlaspi arvense]|uniref:MADS-box domain-containing protein n=1 Tax=Thlaspi arvense TaxID=13288 RepID=A0AAU9RGN0_THLAR|nr:unnamed protein product [Thlaspi arvense]
MGRRRVEIKRIENKARRQTTFTKRRDGLFKKVGELCRLCSAEAAVITISEAGNAFTSGRPSLESIIDRYLSETSETGEGAGAEAAIRDKERKRQLQERYEKAVATFETEVKRNEILDKALNWVEKERRPLDKAPLSCEEFKQLSAICGKIIQDLQ